jgi:hypothetical protein
MAAADRHDVHAHVSVSSLLWVPRVVQRQHSEAKVGRFFERGLATFIVTTARLRTALSRNELSHAVPNRKADQKTHN